VAGRGGGSLHQPRNLENRPSLVPGRGGYVRFLIHCSRKTSGMTGLNRNVGKKNGLGEGDLDRVRDKSSQRGVWDENKGCEEGKD